MDKAIEVIYLKYMKAKISYEGIQRIERYFVPEAALREALLNAVCHKQYESYIPVQVSVYEDGLPDPEYAVHPGYIMIKFTASEDRIVRINGNSHDTERDHPEDKEKKILKLLPSDPSLTVTQLSEKLGCS